MLFGAWAILCVGSVLWMVLYLIGKIRSSDENQIWPLETFLGMTWLFWTAALIIFGVYLPFLVYGPVTAFVVAIVIIGFLVDISIFVLPAFLVSFISGAVSYFYFFSKRKYWTAAFAGNLFALSTLFLMTPSYLDKPIKLAALECAGTSETLNMTHSSTRLWEKLASFNNFFLYESFRKPHAVLITRNGVYHWSYKENRFYRVGQVERSPEEARAHYFCPPK